MVRRPGVDERELVAKWTAGKKSRDEGEQGGRLSGSAPARSCTTPVRRHSVIFFVFFRAYFRRSGCFDLQHCSPRRPAQPALASPTSALLDQPSSLPSAAPQTASSLSMPFHPKPLLSCPPLVAPILFFARPLRSECHPSVRIRSYDPITISR